MSFIEKLCRLCADDLLISVSVENTENLLDIQKLLNFEIEKTIDICTNCFALLNKIQKFSERCRKAQEFLTFVSTGKVPPEDINLTRFQFGLSAEEKADRSTDTHDLDIEIKNEFRNTESQAMTIEEYSLNEPEDFEEITTNAIPEDNCTSANDDIDEDEEQKNSEAEDLTEKKDFTEMALEYSCHICEDQLKNFFGLQSHCRKEHDANAQVNCSCGATLTSRTQIHLHKKLHKPEKFHACDQCDKIYSHQQSLHNHIKKQHPEAEKRPFICTQCPKRFDSEKKLKIHAQVHLPDEKKMIHPCPYCEKKFTKSVNVQTHVRSIHHMERPFLCADCGKNFSTKGALKEHQIIHSDTYPYQCSFCPKKFKNLPRLKTHEDIHNNTQYICTECGISLNTKRTLKMHMVVHSDQKKYKCQYCGSSFKRSKALKNHLILHSGLRPYSCPFCDKTFANGSNCRSHKKKTHPAELAALEASGKTGNSAPNIPRLEQLQPKSQHVITVDGSNVTLHQLPPTSSDIKQDLPSLHIIQDTFEVHQALLEPQTH